MSIAFDTSNVGSVAGAASFTFPHTCTGNNVILLVAVNITNTGNTASATYNGNTMTQIDNQTATSVNSYLFYILIGTADGLAHNVIVSTTGGTNNILAISASYTGAKQSGQPDAHNKAAAASVAVTVVAAGAWVVGMSAFAIGTGVTWTAGVGFTLRQSFDTSGGFGLAFEDSNGSVTAGSKTVAFTTSAGSPAVVLGASIAVLPIVNTITFSPTSYALTFLSFFLTKQRTLTIAVTSYVLTMKSFIITYIPKKWTNRLKNISAWVNRQRS